MKKGPSPYTLGVGTAFPVLRDLGSQESESIHRTLLSFNPGYRLKEIIKRHRKSAMMVNDRLATGSGGSDRYDPVPGQVDGQHKVHALTMVVGQLEEETYPRVDVDFHPVIAKRVTYSLPLLTKFPRTCTSRMPCEINSGSIPNYVCPVWRQKRSECVR